MSIKKDTIKRLAEGSGKKYGGELRNWRTSQLFGSKVVLGDLYNDPAYRWEDGHLIHTSEVVWIESDEDYVETLNTFYMLGDKQ